MNRYNDDDFELIDGQLILKDGHTHHVRLTDEDSMQREVAAYAAQKMADAAAKRFGLSDSFAMNRPGFRHLMDGKAIAAKERAYELRDRADTEAWRDADGSHTSGVEGAGERVFAGRRVGDRCMVKSKRDIGEDGDAGHIQEIDGELCCVSDNHRSDDGLNARELLEREYQAYDQRLRDSWKG